jgi:hypothetical protein
LAAWLVDVNLLLRDFGPYEVVFMVGLYYYNRCHGKAVKVFIYSLFNDVFSSSSYIASNERMTSE